MSVIGLIIFGIWLTIRIIRHMKCTIINFDANDEWAKQEFKACNVIVFGKKGKGKDLLFAHVIDLLGELHYANMPYNSMTDVRLLTDLELKGNSFKKFLDGNIVKSAPVFEERKNFFISDGGIFLPCQYNNELNKKYRSLPMFYALSRQLYEMNIHVNVQSLGRLWDKLREQADSFIKVTGRKDHGDYFVVKCIYYDDYNLALRGTLPEDNRSNFTAEYRQFKIYKDELTYDTHYFKNVFINTMPKVGALRTIKGVLKRVKEKRAKASQEVSAAKSAVSKDSTS